MKTGMDFTGVERKDLDYLYPTLFKTGEGAYVWDMDDNKYLDFTGATGAILLGYKYNKVDEAVFDYILKYGNIFITKYSQPRVELAKKLVELIPCAEYVSFHKTGSCATSTAVRLAKLHSGKEVILSAGYHGWHDWQLNMFDDYKIPDEKHINFEYSLDKLEELIEKHYKNVAAIIVTPEPNFFPIEYFRELRDIATKNNILLIFDEVASGFRFALGGYQKYSGVIPDMATFGKGLANGYALSAVVGPKEIMKTAAEKAHTWSTFDAELGPMVASLKTIEEYEEKNVVDYINKIGQYFINKLKKLFDNEGIVYEIRSHPSIFHIIFNDIELYDAWILESLKQGVVLSRYDYQLISYSHKKSDIDFAIKKLEIALKKCRSRFPHSFNQINKGVDEKVLEKRLRYEIGGTINYRRKITN